MPGKRLGSAHVIRRLRAHRLVPAGTPVRLVLVTGCRPPVPVRWKAVDAASGRDLGVASRHWITDVAGCPDWRLQPGDGGIMIELGAAGEDKAQVTA